ncbi:hypothetical protein BABINDRAFT_162201 [Babjeviella inositovora NRRL Y-12698]|uniref:Uncharacterized protein n=1 Tax=Babjeviella inositovora NRRL Y-12698 TaxID=984486 RepID=A0A1E3QPZ0_9ASCO|nr:uncharacterized protein BABINDRAFT_162201 [Babjeviella inositovora NRRL Y-12698]ODQ79142.1 hypothetical protein BABINDRAFT_162201 [Babjeviella inositovora NRRL Y-12698]
MVISVSNRIFLRPDLISVKRLQGFTAEIFPTLVGISVIASTKGQEFFEWVAAGSFLEQWLESVVLQHMRWNVRRKDADTPNPSTRMHVNFMLRRPTGALSHTPGSAKTIDSLPCGIWAQHMLR